MKRLRSERAYFDYHVPSTFVEIKAIHITEDMVLQSEQPLFDVKDGQTLLLEKELGGVIVKEILCSVGDVKNEGDVLFTYVFCKHPLIVHGLCTSCGSDCSEKVMEGSKTHVSLLPSQPDVLFDRSVALEVSNKTNSRLALSNKLTLILDLDLTLLHATSDRRHASVLKRAPTEDLEDIHSFKLFGVRHWVKLRPGVPEFLAKAHEKYELHIFTHGKKDYGNKIAEILDPEGIYFAPQEGVGQKRVTTLDEAYTKHEIKEKFSKGLREYKSLKRLFPVSQERVLVLDDNNVWGGSPNVIRVIPYFFWSRLPPEEVGLFESDESSDDEVEEMPLSMLYFSEAAKDDHILELTHVLDQVHSRFYAESSSKSDLHVTDVFSEVRRDILKGCKIVFSAVFASDVCASDQALWKLAEEYGCECCESLDEDGVTHVVAGQAHTKKVIDAIKGGIRVVHVKWLFDCIRHFKKMDENWYQMLPSERYVDKKSMRLMEELKESYLAKVEEEEEEEEEIEMDMLNEMIENIGDNSDNVE